MAKLFSGLGKSLAYLGWTAAVLVIVLPIALVLNLYNSYEHYEQAPRDNLQWGVYRLGREYDRFHIALLSWRPGDPAAEAEVRQRFDILYSRFDLLKAAAFTDLREPGSDTSSPHELTAMIMEIDTLLSTVHPLQPADVELMRSEVERVEAAVNRLLLQTLQEVTRVTDQHNADVELAVARALAIFFVLLLALMVALLFVLRQERRLRRDGLELRETARKLAEAQRIARFGTFHWDFVLDTVRWSDELARTYGLPVGGEMDGEHFRLLLHPEDKERVEAAEKQALDRSAISGKPERRDGAYRITRPDGGVAHVVAAAELLATRSGEPVSMTCTVRDVTVEEVQKRALEESDLNLAEAQRLAHVGSFRGNLLTGETRWSDELFRICGLLPEDSHAQPAISDIVHPDDLAALMDTMHRNQNDPVPGGKRQFPLEHRLLRPDGEVRHVRGTMEFNYDDQGVAYALAGTLRDVTNEYMQQSALEQAKTEAETANAAKSEFLAVMSHELRTPMNGVLGMLNALDETGLGAEQKALVGVARTSADALLMILNDILDLSKIEAGKLELEPTPFELGPLLRSVVQLYVQQARAKGVLLDSEIAPDVPVWFEGDAGRLRQVVLNLVSNAVKFTAKGSVTIRARLLEHQAAGMCMLRIEVVDTGPGIAPEKRNEVFARFSQLDRSYARRFGGTGLGLAISRRLAELMGGTVDFFSEPGVETTFWCETPLRVVKPEAASLNTATTSQMRQLKVLVVEDNTTNQLVMRRLLENMGHQVVVVANGAEAVESVMAGSYDLVLMDVSMPVMDGIEATRRIRALGSPDNAIPIIAVTANAMQGDIDACLQAGMNHFLSKPIVRSKLEAALAAFALETAAAPLEPTLDEETRLPGDEGLTRLALLEADIGRDMMPSLLSACASDLVRILGDLRTAFEHGDFKHFGHAAHAIRGLAVMLGISGLASLAANAEAACRDALEPAFGATPADFEKRIARASADISAQMRAYDSVG